MPAHRHRVREARRVARATLDHVLRHPGVLGGAIYAAYEDGQAIECLASDGLLTEPEDASGAPGGGTVGKAIASGRMGMSSATVDDEGFVLDCAYPLGNGAPVVGALQVLLRASIDRVDEERRSLDPLVGVVSVALVEALGSPSPEDGSVVDEAAVDLLIEGWAQALIVRDPAPEGHTERTTELTVRMAGAFGVDDEWIVHARRGALLHDVGMMRVPERILFKREKLTEEEWEVLRLHPVYAGEILDPIPLLRPAMPIPQCHHERWNGSGYPAGLAGDEIPLEARIFAVADVWDSMLSSRPYRDALRRAQAWELIEKAAGVLFDPEVVEVFRERELDGD